MRNDITTFHFLRERRSQFSAIVRTLQCYDELVDLIAWAKRKRLYKPLSCYQNRLEDEANRLFRATVRTPRLVQLASIVHCFKKQLLPTPRYYRGYAAKYRRFNLTGKPKESYSF